jgi:hypothetical protein
MFASPQNTTMPKIPQTHR